MNIQPMKITDTIVLEFFSLHDDFMIEFLGEDSHYYTRYTESENIENVWVVFEENHAGEQGCTKLFLDTRITLEPAVSLYRSFGFDIVFQQGLYVQMEKNL